MRTDRRNIALIVFAAAAVLLAVFIAWRTFLAPQPPAPIDPDVLDADRRLNEDLQRQQPAPPDPAPSSGPPPSRTSGAP